MFKDPMKWADGMVGTNIRFFITIVIVVSVMVLFEWIRPGSAVEVAACFIGILLWGLKSLYHYKKGSN